MSEMLNHYLLSYLSVTAALSAQVLFSCSRIKTASVAQASSSATNVVSEKEDKSEDKSTRSVHRQSSRQKVGVSDEVSQTSVRESSKEDCSSSSRKVKKPKLSSERKKAKKPVPSTTSQRDKDSEKSKSKSKSNASSDAKRSRDGATPSEIKPPPQIIVQTIKKSPSKSSDALTEEIHVPIGKAGKVPAKSNCLLPEHKKKRMPPENADLSTKVKFKITKKVRQIRTEPTQKSCD